MNNYKSISKNFKIIDSHHHFWDLSMQKHPWLCARPLIKFRYGNYEKICKNFLVKDFKNVSKNFNVSKTIHMEAEWDIQNPFGEILQFVSREEDVAIKGESKDFRYWVISKPKLLSLGV